MITTLLAKKSIWNVKQEESSKAVTVNKFFLFWSMRDFSAA